MKILKQIRVSDIKNILDDYYEKIKREEIVCANVAFLSPEAFGKNRNIKEWFELHRDCVTPYRNLYPQLLYEEKNGILEKNKRGLYAIDDKTLENVANKKDAVLYYRRLNYGRDFNSDPEIYKMISERKYRNPIADSNEYDLSNVRLTIATVFPEGQFVNTDESLLDLFDIYEVTATFADTIDFLLNECEDEICELQAKINDTIQEDSELIEWLAEKREEKELLGQIAKRNVNIQHSAIFPPVYVSNVLNTKKKDESFTCELKRCLEADNVILGIDHNLGEIFIELEKIGDL